MLVPIVRAAVFRPPEGWKAEPASLLAGWPASEKEFPMSILLNRETRVLVQGITGKIGRTQAKWMLEYGTRIVAGVTPGKGGETVEGVPVFDSVREAVRETSAEASVFFVPARSVKDTVFQDFAVE